MMLRTLFAGAAVATAVLAGSASAATLSGTFKINVYTYDSLGIQANADATAANVALQTLSGSVTYTGDLDFFTSIAGGGPTVGQFLNSGGGTVVGAGAFLSAMMSAGGFGTTTLLDISGVFGTAVSGNIQHDDGISLFDSTLALVANSPTPTANGDTDFVASAGAFRLIYSAANGNPEELSVDVSPIPVPAAGLLLLGALGGLAALRRRKA